MQRIVHQDGHNNRDWSADMQAWYSHQQRWASLHWDWYSRLETDSSSDRRFLKKIMKRHIVLVLVVPRYKLKIIRIRYEVRDKAHPITRDTFRLAQSRCWHMVWLDRVVSVTNGPCNGQKMEVVKFFIWPIVVWVQRTSWNLLLFVWIHLSPKIGQCMHLF